jgi:polyisoprenyl-teichoic acid--peptidoglycan teichoic acid transferase
MKFHQIRTGILIICIAAIISGCSAPIASSAGISSNPVALLVADANATPTPTPFLPINPTPTYIPTAVPTLAPTAIPKKPVQAPGDIQPVEIITLPEEQINILLLGSDRRGNYGGYRTDTIILLSINTTTKTVSMVSFPRDLYIYIPGWTHQRINTAMFHGGFDLLARTLEYNFGIKPEYYVMINFSAFRQVINQLGGIDVQVAKEFYDSSYNNPLQHVPAGTVPMDGKTALWYARLRMSTNDFDRSRRQQEVIQALAEKLLSMNALESADDLYDIYINNVTTNFTWTEIAPLIPLSIHFRDTSKIHLYQIGPKQVYDWVTPGGGMVLLPRQDKVIKLLREVIGTQ